jgi:anhydro-N-acetylmuramic acid kinase
VKKEYNAIGLMSGSSLDGLDICYVNFYFENNLWDFEIIAAQSYAYSTAWVSRLRDLPTQSAVIYQQTHIYFGHYCAELVNKFIAQFEIDKQKIDLLASHGHTIFHQPHKNYTAQIGDGASLAALTGLLVVNDFRSTDIALGGQGAPLVPIGDTLLFNNYTFCLNLGGIANLTFQKDDKIIAFDCAPCNQILNTIANFVNLEYDAEGNIAANGEANNSVLQSLNNHTFYQLPFPKSLDNNFAKEILGILGGGNLNINDSMATASLHIGFQIANAINKFPSDKESCLVTGGGAYNATLINNIQKFTTTPLILPDDQIIKFKEALIFAFLGVLRIIEIPNVLSSVTGATKNHIAGAIYLP